MASAEAVLIMDAKDHASAQVRHFGGAVEQAGRQAATAGVKTAQMSTSLTGMVDRVKAAQVPLRNLSAVLSGFGLSFIGIAAATMAVRGMVTGILQNEQALIGAQITLRRWGLTVDDTRRLTETFSAVLGRTAGTTLAGIEESMARWLLSFGPQRVEILRAAKAIETWTGIPVATTLAAWKVSQDEGTGSVAEWTAEAKLAAAAASDFQKALVDFKATTGPIFEWIVEQGMKVGAGIAKGLFWTLTLTPQEQAAYEGRLAFYQRTWHGTLTAMAAIWQGFTAALGVVWAAFTAGLGAQWEALAMLWAGITAGIGAFFQETWTAVADWWVSLTTAIGTFFKEKWTGLVTWWGNVISGIIGFFRDIWTGFTAWWGELIGNIGAFFVDKWTALGEWWGRLTTGIGDFWRGIWEGMKGVAISVYNFIADRLNDAIALVNDVIRLINRGLGLIGVSIPEIGLRVSHAAMPAPTISAPGPVFSAPPMPSLGGDTIVIPVSIGDRPLTEIIIDALTGAVRQRELSA